MFRRSNSQNVKLVAAAGVADGPHAAAALAVCSDGGPHHRVQVSRVGNREVARFQLQVAPRHVIPPQHKKDILKNAFRLQRPSKEQSSKILSKSKSKMNKHFPYLFSYIPRPRLFPPV